MPVDSTADILSKIRGYTIAIYNGKIMAIEKSLKELHKKLENLMSKGGRCEIEYIEKGESIYG